MKPEEITYVLCQTNNEDALKEYSDVNDINLGVSNKKLRKLKIRAKQHTKKR